MVEVKAIGAKIILLILHQLVSGRVVFYRRYYR